MTAKKRRHFNSSVRPMKIRSKVTLRDYYLPDIKNGGIFLRTNKAYAVGDEVFLTLTLRETGPDSQAMEGSISLEKDGTTGGVQFRGKEDLSTQKGDRVFVYGHVIELCDRDPLGFPVKGFKMQFSEKNYDFTKQKIAEYFGKQSMENK
jgi:type IV pilus assembly protein PilZ